MTFGTNLVAPLAFVKGSKAIIATSRNGYLPPKWRESMCNFARSVCLKGNEQSSASE